MSIRPTPWRYNRPGLTESGPSQPSGSSSGPWPIRRFKVILHRTPGQGLMFVARVVMDLTRFGDAEAEQRMWQVHHLGHSLVFITHLERAEFYAEQFADRGLAVSLEPA